MSKAQTQPAPPPLPPALELPGKFIDLCFLGMNELHKADKATHKIKRCPAELMEVRQHLTNISRVLTQCIKLWNEKQKGDQPE